LDKKRAAAAVGTLARDGDEGEGGAQVPEMETVGRECRRWRQARQEPGTVPGDADEDTDVGGGAAIEEANGPIGAHPIILWPV
jgi:hypothetical protein